MRKNTWILIAILAGALLLRLPNLTGPDMASDDAFYAFRSVGYLDYAAATNRQSTPVTWFDTAQWWQWLSFHDAPPLVFAIEYIFFELFGHSIFVARLPFILAGLASIYAVFLLGRILGDARAGLVAAAALAAMNYHVWISRIGFLDGFLILWIALSLYFFLKATASPSYYLLWGAAAAAGILTKYTFLFMGFVFLTLLLTSHKDAWKNRRFLLGLALFFILLTPILSYNIMMWSTRGHPDAAFSTLLGMQPEDFRGLTRTTGTNPFRIIGVITTIGRQFSPGITGIAILSFFGALIASIRYHQRRKIYIPLLIGTISLLTMLTVIGDHERYGVIILPFVTLIAALEGIRLWDWNGARAQKIIIVAVGLVAALEITFTVQNQLLPAPLLTNPLLPSTTRPRWEGYNVLDSYMDSFYKTFPDPSDIIIFAEAPQLAEYQRQRILTRQKKYGADGPRQKHLVVFDNRMEWMPALWIFERRRLYDNMPIHSLDQFLETISTKGIKGYATFGIEEVTFIIAADTTTLNAGTHHELFDRFLEKLFATAKPIDYIRNADGKISFMIFRAPLLPQTKK